MPTLYSDIEICAKVVCSDTELFRHAILEFRRAVDSTSDRCMAATQYLTEMENCYHRLEQMCGLRPLEG